MTPILYASAHAAGVRIQDPGAFGLRQFIPYDPSPGDPDPADIPAALRRQDAAMRPRTPPVSPPQPPTEPDWALDLQHSLEVQFDSLSAP
jgi:hypothetical protein